MYFIANDDFTPLPATPLSFTGAGGIECLNVSILEDTFVELDETFSVLLSTSSPAVRLTQDMTNVTIQDNDMVTIGWSSETYQFDENGVSAHVCAEIIEGQIDRLVTVLYSTVDVTALGNYHMHKNHVQTNSCFMT